jgi:hypothetical protein
MTWKLITLWEFGSHVLENIWHDHLLGFGFKIPFVNMFLALFSKTYGIINWGLFKCRSPQ